jgi:anti-anti-sigma factor
MDQFIASYDRDGVLVVPLPGEFDVGNADDLERHLTEVTTAGRATVFDFSDTGYLDSSALAVLIRRKKALGASVAFAVPEQSKVRLIFDVSGLLEALSIANSVDEAVKNLSDPRLGTP